MSDRPATELPEEIEIPPEMIEAAADVLFEDPFLNLSRVNSVNLAEAVLKAALQVR